MKNQTKWLIGVVVVVVFSAGAYLGTNTDLFQGKLSPVTKCNIVFENFDPSGITAKFGDSVDFKWNGPGCSRYKWTQYELCFENVSNSQEFACIGVTNSNHKTLTGADWNFISNAMKTVTSRVVYTKWYVQSLFGNAIKGEILKTEPWKFSYTK